MGRYSLDGEVRVFSEHEFEGRRICPSLIHEIRSREEGLLHVDEPFGNDEAVIANQCAACGSNALLAVGS